MPRNLDWEKELEELSVEEARKAIQKRIRNLSGQERYRLNKLEDIEEADPKRKTILQEIGEREAEKAKLKKKLTEYPKPATPTPKPKVLPVNPKPQPTDENQPEPTPKPKKPEEVQPKDDQTTPIAPAIVTAPYSDTRVFRPFIGGALIGTILAKIVCTTALSTVVPFAAPVVGFVFGYGINVALDLSNGSKFFSRQTHKHALRSGFVGALGASIIPGADALGFNPLGDAFGACAVTDSALPADIVSPVDELGTEAPADQAPLDGKTDTETGSGEATEETTPEGEIVEQGDTATAEQEAPPVETMVPLTADDVFDVTVFLDLAQGESDIVMNLLNHALENGVDSSHEGLQELAGKVDAGFDFVDSAGSAEFVGVFNSLLEEAMQEASDGGTSVTPDEYQNILEVSIDQLNQAEFITADNDPTTFQDSVLDRAERAEHIQTANELRLNVA